MSSHGGDGENPLDIAVLAFEHLGLGRGGGRAGGACNARHGEPGHPALHPNGLLPIRGAGWTQNLVHEPKLGLRGWGFLWSGRFDPPNYRC